LNNLKLIDIPYGSILGINYSGMHDSAIAIVSPDGQPVFALSLERLTRVKQDGRPPYGLLVDMPWDKIDTIAVSTEEYFAHPAEAQSRILMTRLKQPRTEGLRHGKPFYDFLNSLPVKKEFVCHQTAHVCSAFWGSGFDDAICVSYDGGMCNSPWFGGVYKASRKDGITSLDMFSALDYPKVTSLYTFVTALLGFAPNKHEGKITGLAAYGKPTDACRKLLLRWFNDEFMELESTLEWAFAYDAVKNPTLLVNEIKIARFREVAKDFSREELAATVQEFAEEHILNILKKSKELGWANNNICLAGGLFANVKINQKAAKEWGGNLFVAPPMTDDGTALGAAWHILSKRGGFNPRPINSMYLGSEYSCDEIEAVLKEEGIVYRTTSEADKEIACLLSQDCVVGLFIGKSEFGPRGLCHRSILAQATKSDINNNLNNRLNRTEFMPFAPITIFEDGVDCYNEIEKIGHAAEFMTVTVNCTESMRSSCPAVVHVDFTARPQLVKKDVNQFVYSVLENYKKLTEKPALVNTSFNIHEEPIVDSVDDALRGFFESGLDYLYLDYGILVSYEDNKDVALRYLREKLHRPIGALGALGAIISFQQERLSIVEHGLVEKEEVIQQKEQVLQELSRSLLEKEAVIQELDTYIKQKIKGNK